MSSLRTADSEVIERMAGTMDVFQRMKSRSNINRTTGSINSAGGVSVDTLWSSVDAAGGGASLGILPDDLPMFSAPVEILPLQAPGGYDPLRSTPSSFREDSICPITSSPLLLTTPMSPTSPSVADRIHAFENRVSLEQSSSPPVTNTKYPKKRGSLWIMGSFREPAFLLRILTHHHNHHHLSTSSGDS
jgi:hypothetical protein